MDYEVRTKVLLDCGFDDRECNCLMFDGMKNEMVERIRAVFEHDKTLSEYITSDLNFTFSGYKVELEYTFSCNDENEAEAEGFSAYCLRSIEGKLQEQGFRVKNITSKAEEMDMQWLDRLESMWFG